MKRFVNIALGFAFAASTLAAPPAVHSLDTVKGLTAVGVVMEPVEFKGRKALRVLEQAKAQSAPDALVLVNGVEFRDGTIELDVAGEPAPGSSEGARGFAGIAFRTKSDGSAYEVFYIRPTNGRANDQVRRNHATQYASHPDYPWYRLRKEEPEKYESYADMQPATWTRLKVVVKGQTAQLYIDGASQPCLIVNDLKLGTGGGGIALWVGAEALAHFSNLKVTPE